MILATSQHVYKQQLNLEPSWDDNSIQCAMKVQNQPCVAQQETKSCTNDSAPYRPSDQVTLGGASSRGAWLFLPSQSQLPASLMQVSDYVETFSHGLVTFNGLLKFPLNLAHQSLWAGYSATSNDWPFCWPLWTGSSWCANWQLGHLQLHFLW